MADQHASRDPISRAHLTGRSHPTPPIHRYPAGSGLEDFVERYWIPVWDVAEPQSQKTLQYPVCLIVVSNSYARFYGTVRGMSTVTLEATGWAVGAMLRPAAGRLVWGRPVSDLTDRFVDLSEVQSLESRRLVPAVRALMDRDPDDPDNHAAAIAEVERSLRAMLPVDAQGRLINDVIAWLRDHPEVTRVSEICDAFDLGERALQRLTLDRVGLSPKWLIQRRRLHDAVERLKAGATTVGEVAADLGYADQAHFTHDFRTVTGMTPGAFLADQF
ncbi:AraC family transcriptional regulator [Knoellia sinensis KCTC 19936]|uniref:AraC family transcriptional regulator n=1 Tax=Knoellia sinensis KCTC 19936 TaxID=1385520 RepID=A0A0A0JAG5_9MICO|nr:AraC family transcriptional regulator [Knoellia sinensis]KGN34133.1 AraC family transcriptional regulator [Knoellia sinensis KCTC 19936]